MDFSHIQHDVGHSPADAEYAVTPPGAGYEHTDANVWIIVKFGLWLLISAVVIHVAMGFMFGLFVQQREESDPQFPLAVGQERRLPAAPRLQQFPVNEHYEFRQGEEAVLQKYGWVSKEAGTVRLPIAEAMRRVVEGGLPSRAPQAPDQGAADAPRQDSAPVQQTPGLMPMDSSSGRTIERRRQ
jgi:hypothetical protein